MYLPKNYVEIFERTAVAYCSPAPPLPAELGAEEYLPDDSRVHHVIFSP